jgi:nucleoside-diphosphate-sugar epimerase
MKILVTGASGLLGTEICRQLKQNPNNEVWAMDNHSRSSTIPPCDVWVKTDLLKDTAFDGIPRDFDQVYHYAAINGTKNFYERPTEVLTNNFISDINMFRFAESCDRLQKLIYASSSEIVSDDPVSPTPEHQDIVIENIHNARWSYRLAKITSENYLANSGLPWVICRYFNIYGENSKPGHFIADQIDKIESGIFEVTGGSETRSFCYVEDGIAATIYCANHVTREVVNIGTDAEISIPAAADIIARAMGHVNVNWNLKPGLPGSTVTRRPDVSKLRSIWPEYQPRSFAEGIKKIVANRSK